MFQKLMIFKCQCIVKGVYLLSHCYYCYIITLRCISEFLKYQWHTHCITLQMLGTNPELGLPVVNPLIPNPGSKGPVLIYILFYLIFFTFCFQISALLLVIRLLNVKHQSATTRIVPRLSVSINNV